MLKVQLAAGSALLLIFGRVSGQGESLLKSPVVCVSGRNVLLVSLKVKRVPKRPKYSGIIVV